MLRHDRQRERRRAEEDAGWEGDEGHSGSSSRSEQGGAKRDIRYEAGNLAPRLVNAKGIDSSGRTLPSAERAPLPKNLT